MLPHVQVGDIAPRGNLLKMLNRWTLNRNVRFVADSAFGCVSIVDKIKEFGGTATVACAPNTNKEIWDILSNAIPRNSWRAALIDGKLFCLSSSVTENNAISYLRVITTGFTYSTVNFDSSTVITEDDATENEGNRTSMPLYSYDELMKLKVVELKELCKKFNVKPGKRKPSTVQSLVRRSENLNSDMTLVRKVSKYLKETSFSGMSPGNELYRAGFNPVDLADRLHARVKSGHGIRNWKTAFLLNILRNAVINSWVFTQQTIYKDWLPYRGLIIMFLFTGEEYE